MSIADLVRPELRDLAPYEAAVQVSDTIRLNANEAAWSSSKDRFRRPLNRYPELRPTTLQAALAERFSCPVDKLLVTRGSSEAIDLLVRVFCRAAIDNVVTAKPGFSMYGHYAKVQGAELREVETDGDNDFLLTAAAILDACDDGTRLIFLCTPNNPTGTVLDQSVIEAILEARRGRSVIVVDEAYIEFSNQATMIALLERFDNLVVLRTLSKALAFAGARCGAAIAGAETIRILSAVQAPYALATPVVECVENALQDEWLSEAELQIAQVVNERERMSIELDALPYIDKVWPSEANFILIKSRRAKDILQQGQRDNILLRYFGGALHDCIRITIGSETENHQLLNSLRKLEGQ